MIGERDRIEDEAVARGVLPEAVRFSAAADDEYRVFVIGGDAEDDAGRTNCETSDGGSFSGSNQGVSVVLGNAASVGTFDAPAGELTVTCAGPEGLDFVVTPTGGSLVRSILTIVGGALIVCAGLGLAIWGLVGRRVPV